MARSSSTQSNRSFKDWCLKICGGRSKDRSEKRPMEIGSPFNAQHVGGDSRIFSTVTAGNTPIHSRTNTSASLLQNHQHIFPEMRYPPPIMSPYDLPPPLFHARTQSQTHLSGSKSEYFAHERPFCRPERSSSFTGHTYSSSSDRGSVALSRTGTERTFDS